MLVFRICREAHANDLTGAGARIHGGRWNRKGTPMVYASCTRALATLECIVHVDPTVAPAGLRMVTIDVPDTLSSEELRPADLPPGWERFPGSAWVSEQRSAVLFVPSAVVADERNILLNPLHSEFNQIKIVDIRPYQLDPRVLD